jgi:hypothetical protein
MLKQEDLKEYKMDQEAKYKMLKNRFNKESTSGVLLEDREVMLYSSLSSININENSINLQPGVGGHISFSSFDIRQPMCRQSSIPADFLPGAANITSRKTFDLPILDQMIELSALTAILGGLLSE